jgi:hypothetical protein
MCQFFILRNYVFTIFVLNAVMRVKVTGNYGEFIRSALDFIDLRSLYTGNNQQFRVLKNIRLFEIFTQI